jgi:hypothetical protein
MHSVIGATFCKKMRCGKEKACCGNKQKLERLCCVEGFCRGAVKTLMTGASRYATK